MTAQYEGLLKMGNEYEDYIDRLLKANGVYIGLYQTKEEQYNIGESQKGVEIKYNSRFTELKSVYVEVTECTKDGNKHVLSGILRNDNTRWMLMGDYKHAVMFDKGELAVIYLSGCCTVIKPHNTSTGFVMGLPDVLYYGKMFMLLSESMHTLRLVDKETFKRSINS